MKTGVGPCLLTTAMPRVTAMRAAGGFVHRPTAIMVLQKRCTTTSMQASGSLAKISTNDKNGQNIVIEQVRVVEEADTEEFNQEQHQKPKGGRSVSKDDNLDKAQYIAIVDDGFGSASEVAMKKPAANDAVPFLQPSLATLSLRANAAGTTPVPRCTSPNVLC